MRRGVEAILLDGSVLLRKYEPAKRGRRAKPSNVESLAQAPVSSRWFSWGEILLQVCPETGAYILFDRITHYYY